MVLYEHKHNVQVWHACMHLIMSEDEVKRILKDIEKQGFPLEVKTSEVLEAHGWEVTNQVAYLDHEEEKYRTVDILAQKMVVSKSPELAFWVDLVVECKKSTKPWVFYASDFDLNKAEINSKVVSSMQFFMSTHAYQKKSDRELHSLMTRQVLYENHLMSPIFRKVGHLSFEPFTSGQGGSIPEAQIQVCNAILDLKEQAEEFHLPFPYGIVWIPIIVLDGHLYLYENEKLSPEKGLYCYVNYAGNAFMIEIMIESFLDTYLATLGEQIQRFKNSIT